MKFLTWLDVERRLREETFNYSSMPEGIQSIQCFYDGIDIGIQVDAEAKADSFLKDIFKDWYDEKNKEISLDLDEEKLPIEFIFENEPFMRVKPAKPLWQDVIYLADSGEKKEIIQIKDDEPRSSDPPIIAFHSFKGGVGRTTTLMCYVLALLEKARDKKEFRILIIDSDLEAPGITYWFNKLKKPTVSFIHYLEAIHYPIGKENAMVDLFARELKKTSISEANNEIFVLPAFTNEKQLLDTPILPENIVKGAKGPWHYADEIQKLGRKLDIDYIFIDMRAGLSEISSPLLFDPRVEKFLVTTIAEQSVAGTSLILKQLTKMMNQFVPSNDKTIQFLTPNIILSMLTDDLKQSKEFENVFSVLNASFDLDTSEINLSDLSPLPIIEFPFDQSLMNLSSWEDVRNKLNQPSVIPKHIREWAEDKVPNEAIENGKGKKEDQIQNLFKTCEKYEFAEKGESVDFLTTEAITNMAKMFRNEPPRIVSVGAKGSGKTFCYLQIARSCFWSEFVKKVMGNSTIKESQGLLFPLLQATNLGQVAKNDTNKVRKIVWEELGVTKTSLPQDYIDSINMEIKRGEKYDASDWTSFWIKLFSQALGIELETNNIQGLNSFFQLKKLNLTFLFDGLEDIFSSIGSNRIQQTALKALLDLPNRISELRNPSWGLIIFVRRDFLKFSFLQNRAQFESLYELYSLSWDATSFLELVYWICYQSKVIGFSNPVVSLRTHEISKNLELLWGRKLGRDNSNEANTARWVYAALTDFKGWIQARDIVRILLYASKLTLDNPGQVKFTTWENTRLLPPVAIKRSLELCSKNKIKEAKEEYPDFKDWVEHFESEYKETDRVVPFTAEQYDLQPRVTDMLISMGIIIEAEDSADGVNKFYMPEIYRTGLKFTMKKGARPRVLALKRMALGKDLF